MRPGQGQFVAALVALVLVALFWLFLSNAEFGGADAPGRSAATGGGSAGAARGTAVNAADRAMLELALDRYKGLARNMTARIQTAEQAIKKLQRLQQQQALGTRSKPKLPGRPFRPTDADPSEGGSSAVAAGGGAGENAGSGAGESGGGEENDEEEETEEEKAKRQEAEEKEQRQLIGYDEATKKFRRFRPDFKCGDRVQPLPDSELAECDPAGESPCCSSIGWCGKSRMHCDCDMCQDYRSKVKLSVVGVKVLKKQRECAEIAYTFGPQDSPRACADLALPRVECGRMLMFSETYPSWGCRCCAAGTAEGVEVKPEWTVWSVDVKAEPLPGA